VAGETWFDGRSTFSNPVLKVYDGTQWRPSTGFSVDNSTGNFSLAKALTVSTLVVNGTGAGGFVRLPNGPAGDESLIPAAAGMVRFDTTLNQFRGYNGTQWADLGSGTLAALDVSGNALIGGTLTVNGNITLGNDATIDVLTVNAQANFSGNTLVGINSTNTLTVNASTTFSSPTRHVNQQPLRFHSGTVAGSNYVALRAPSSIAANVVWTLPNIDGTPGQLLGTDGTGSLSWSTPASGATVTVSSSAPTSPPPDNGDLWYNSLDGRLYVYYVDANTDQWVDVSPVSSGVTNIKIIDNVSAGFNGTTAAFNLTSSGTPVIPVSAQQMMVVLGGVVQRAGTDYIVTGSTITFLTAPANGLTFYAVVYGAAITGSTVADGAITTAKLQNGAVTSTKLTIDGNILPDSDNTYDLGSPTFRFANIYTGDLHLANDRGNWTVIEESEYLSLRNNKTGKTFKLVMEEVEG
jgi:hypothetical protein